MNNEPNKIVGSRRENYQISLKGILELKLILFKTKRHIKNM